ncbi:MAG: S-layer homology domain-containing protein [Bacillota bacterium]|nr:S-layer homology domain-containing protein [Bacillota bacterium]
MKRFLTAFLLILSLLPVSVFASDDGFDMKSSYDAEKNAVVWENDMFAATFTGNSASDVKTENGMVKSVSFPGTVQVQFKGVFDQAFLYKNNGNGEYSDNFFTNVEQVAGTNDTYETNSAVLTEGEYTLGFILDYGSYATGQSITIYVGSGAQNPDTQQPTAPGSSDNGSFIQIDTDRASYFTDSTTLSDGANISEWAASEVNEALQKSIVPKSIYDESNYKRAITRKEFAYVMVGAMQSFSYTFDDLTSYFKAYGFHTDFTDSNNDLIIQIARMNNIINGTSETTFSPDGLLTREQAAAMLERLYDQCQTQYGIGKPIITDPTYFADRDKFSSWAESGINFVSALTDPQTSRLVMGGVGDDCFLPDGQLTVEQALIAAKRMISFAESKHS